MRWLALVIAFVAAHCSRDRGPPSGPPGPAVSAPRPAVPPLVFAPLAWDLTEADAVARLAAAGMAPRTDEQRGYFTTPDQPHAVPGTVSVAHTIEPVVLFTPRPGWHGTAHYPSPGAPLDEITVTASLTADAARAALDDLEHHHGPPAERRDLPSSLQLVWHRDGARLVATAGLDGQLAIRYRREPAPVRAP